MTEWRTGATPWCAWMGRWRCPPPMRSNWSGSAQRIGVEAWLCRQPIARHRIGIHLEPRLRATRQPDRDLCLAVPVTGSLSNTLQAIDRVVDIECHARERRFLGIMHAVAIRIDPGHCHAAPDAVLVYSGGRRGQQPGQVQRSRARESHYQYEDTHSQWDQGDQPPSASTWFRGIVTHSTSKRCARQANRSWRTAQSQSKPISIRRDGGKSCRSYRARPSPRDNHPLPLFYQKWIASSRSHGEPSS